MSDVPKQVPCIDLLCPLCGWKSSHRIASVAAGKMDIHIRYGHMTDEINKAVDDGQLSEINGKFAVRSNDKAQFQSEAESAIPLDCLVRQRVEEVMNQREEVLRAFIAKYEFEPERAIQIEQRMPDGTTHWFVRRRTDEEMAAGSMMGGATVSKSNTSSASSLKEKVGQMKYKLWHWLFWDGNICTVLVAVIIFGFIAGILFDIWRVTNGIFH